MWFSAERSAEEAITSPRVTLRRKSVISSGRSSIRSTITCTSGSLTSTAWAMRFKSVVLPAFGGATMRQRWPRPMGASRSTTRPHISSGSVSSFRMRVRVDRDELVERGPLAEGAGLQAFDGLDPAQRPAGCRRRRAGDHEAPASRPSRVDQLARNERVLGGRQVVGLGGDEHARRRSPSAAGRGRPRRAAPGRCRPPRLLRAARWRAAGRCLRRRRAARRGRRDDGGGDGDGGAGTRLPVSRASPIGSRRSPAERRRTQGFPGSRDLRTWTPKPPAALTQGPGGNERILRRKNTKSDQAEKRPPGTRRKPKRRQAVR